jgi:hypothetical protein
MSEQPGLQVIVSHDRENGVWFVTDSDIPGLNAEADSFDALVAVVTDLAPELIEANLAVRPGDSADIPLRVLHTVHLRRAQAA